MRSLIEATERLSFFRRMGLSQHRDSGSGRGQHKRTIPAPTTKNITSGSHDPVFAQGKKKHRLPIPTIESWRIWTGFRVYLSKDFMDVTHYGYVIYQDDRDESLGHIILERPNQSMRLHLSRRQPSSFQQLYNTCRELSEKFNTIVNYTQEPILTPNRMSIIIY